MLNTKSIRPKSFIKCKIDGVTVKPKCDTRMPTKSTNVEPSDMPFSLSLPSIEPMAITNAKIITVRPTDSFISSEVNQFIIVKFIIR